MLKKTKGNNEKNTKELPVNGIKMTHHLVWLSCQVTMLDMLQVKKWISGQIYFNLVWFDISFCLTNDNDDKTK